MITTFFYLLIGHAIADFALQSPWVAKGKNRHAGPPPGYNEKAHGPLQPVWIPTMLAHGLIHAGAVAIITNNPALAFVQFVTHTLIDLLKCERVYNVWVDQLLHLWVLAVTAVFFVKTR